MLSGIGGGMPVNHNKGMSELAQANNIARQITNVGAEVSEKITNSFDASNKEIADNLKAGQASKFKKVLQRLAALKKQAEKLSPQHKSKLLEQIAQIEAQLAAVGIQ